MTESQEQQEQPDTSSGEAKTVSLAVAADVAQIRLEDSHLQNSPHAMGQATAERLKSLLSHVSPPLTRSLEAELNHPIQSTTEFLSGNQNKNHTDKQTENGFHKFLHNVFHTSSKPRHHHQGHRFNSVQSSGATTHHCDINSACVPACTVSSSQICGHTDSNQPQSLPQTQESEQQEARRHMPLFRSSLRFPSFKTKLHMPFHSNTAQLSKSQIERTLSHKYHGEFLSGTTTWEQHEAKVKSILHICELYQLGYDLKEYSQKENNGNVTDDSQCDDATKEDNFAPTLFDTRARRTLSSVGFEFRLEKCDDCTKKTAKNDFNCERCITRLYYKPSNTAVTNENRRKFIADGKMYDAIADLCQSAAQEIMAETCNLIWVTVCDGKGGGLSTRLDTHYSNSSSAEDSKSVREWPKDNEGNIIVLEPIRALVSRCNSKSGNINRSNDTFLLSTGKGKVSAGVFSRQHLLTTGLEPSTALPLLLEAQSRGMNCVLIDPNARGDRHGMQTFEESVRSLFYQNLGTEVEDAIIPVTSDGYIYVLAHSAAGGQLVRYLLDQNHGASLLPRIRSITFTDSTHSVQWLKEHQHISSLIQSSKALYVKSANPMRDDGWENAKPGDECAKDHFWCHRFGQIKTVWAGTTDHSLTNLTACKTIWEHFDKNAAAVDKTQNSHADKAE